MPEYRTGVARGLANMLRDKFSTGGRVSELVADSRVSRKYNTFADTGRRREEALARNSVSVVYNRPQDRSSAYRDTSNPYSTTLYGGFSDNKEARLYEYRTMAAFADVQKALDHICNEAIKPDEKGRYCRMFYDAKDASEEVETTLEEEFNKLIGELDFAYNAARYVKSFLVDGELFIEAIVNDETSENAAEGILGFRRIPSEQIETIWASRAGLLVEGFVGMRPQMDVDDPSKVVSTEPVPYSANQILYVHSGNWDSDMRYLVPFIERARRRYIQLSYTEDAIVIYRMARAPERLVFTVPTGSLPPDQAEAYIKRLHDSYWKNKVFDVNNQDISQRYNPQAMLDNYFFAKPVGGESISVTPLAGGQNLGELKDLEYFLKRLYSDMLVPTSFLNAEKTATNPASILQEELRFADFLTTIQRDFARSIKQVFITHLRLKGLWKKFNLRETDLRVEFPQSSSYYVMRENQIASLRREVYSSVVNDPTISNIVAMKNILKMTDEEITNNFRMLKLEAQMEWTLNQIRTMGPDWVNQLAAQAAGGGQPDAMGAAGGAGGGGLDDLFGGGDPMGGGGDAGGMPDLSGIGGGDVPMGGGETPMGAVGSIVTPPQ